MIVERFIELSEKTIEIPYDRSLHHTTMRMDNRASGPIKVETKGAFYDELMRCLSTTDTDENALNPNSIAILKKKLIYYWKINDDIRAKKSVDILSALNGIIGSRIQYYRSLEDPLWEKAIALLKGYIVYDYSLCEHLSPDVTVDRAEAIVGLRKFDVKVSFVDDNVQFEGLDKAYEMLKARVSNMGGIWFIEQLLATLDYNKDFGRLVIYKDGNMPNPLQKPNKKIPYNYMFNVGLTVLSSKGNLYFQHERYFNHTIALFREICFACFDVQNYSIWADIFHMNKDTLEYLKDLVFHESIFDLHQSASRFIIKFLNFIAKKEKSSVHGRIINEFLNFIKDILQRSDPKKFVEFNLKRVPKKYYSPFIRDFLTFTSKNISDFNSDFSGPTDYDCVDFWNYPLIKLSDKRFLIFPKTIAARCCYEAFLSYMRIIDKNLDSNIGKILEEFLALSFRKAHIDLVTGDYSLPINKEGKEYKIKGECDGLIESSDQILLIELKKKCLVRKSRGGSDADILLDLGGSLLDSQVQCLRTELALNKGPLVLKNGNNSIEIKLDKRIVNRISLIQFPFGSIQDRLLIDQILTIFCRYRFGYGIDDESKLSEDELEKYHKIRKRIANLRKKQDDLVYYLNELNLRNPFFNSWFLDIEKLLYLLKGVSGPDDFCNKLKSLKYVSFGTYDIYNEILLRKGMSIDDD